MPNSDAATDNLTETLAALARPAFNKTPPAFTSTLLDEETLDLSVAQPVPTAHLALNVNPHDMAYFYNNCWALDAAQSLALALRLAEEEQLTLTFELYCPDDPGVRAFYQSYDASRNWQTPLWLTVGGVGLHLPCNPLAQTFFKVTTPLLPLPQTGLYRCRLFNSSSTLKTLYVRAVTLKRFRVQRQQQSEWCYAAVLASLLSLLNPANATQSEVVQQALPGQTDVNRQQDITAIAKKLGLAVKYTSRELALYELRDGLQQGLPVPLQINWLKLDAQGQPVLDADGAQQYAADANGNALGHYVVLTGVGPDVPEGDDHVLVKVDDPSKGELQMTFAELKDDYPGAANKHLYDTPHSGRWTYTHRIEKKPTKSKSEKFSAPKLDTSAARHDFANQWAASRPAEDPSARLDALRKELAVLQQLSALEFGNPHGVYEMDVAKIEQMTEESERRLTAVQQHWRRLLWVYHLLPTPVWVGDAAFVTLPQEPKKPSFFDTKQ